MRPLDAVRRAGRALVRNRLRVFVLLVALSGVASVAGLGDSGGPTDRYEATGAERVVDPRPGVTVVTTSPREGTDASMIAFAPNGSVLHYEERYARYFDVDPVAGTAATVEFVAQVDDVDCPYTAETCGAARVERVNVTTGERTVVETFAAERRNDWHDVDRIDDHRLLVADINNRLFVYNLSTGVVEWGYEFRADYRRSAGGVFPTDWTHLNDVEYLGNGTVMASPRNFDQVVFVSRDRGLLRNRTLGSDGNHSRLYEQHNPDYIPADRGGPAVLVADSENDRVVEYRRVDDGWERTWRWSRPGTAWPRDADRLPGGSTLVTVSNGNRVVEVAENGSVVWSAPVDTPYEAERLGTGDESAGGQAATDLGLESRGGALAPRDEESTGDGGPGAAVGAALTSAVLGLSRLVESVVPGPVLNGLLFVLPPSVTQRSLTLAIGAAGLTTVGMALRIGLAEAGGVRGVVDRVRDAVDRGR